VYRDFRRIGRDMFLAGLVTSHGGNMSVRCGDRIIITRRGSMLGRLTHRDLVEVALRGDQGPVAEASSELPVHRQLYLHTPALAIIHAHPPAAVAISLVAEELVPLDAEGALLLGRVPVVTAARLIGDPETGRLLARRLNQARAVLLRSHGSFVVGRSLEEAYRLTSCLEASARIMLFAHLATRHETWGSHRHQGRVPP